MSNYTNTWGTDTRHTSPDNNLAYIWLRGENQHVTIDYIDSSGNTKTMEVDIKFYEQSGMFRLTTEPAPPNHHPTPTLEIPISNSKYIDYIIIQSEPRSECITIPRFHFSLEILNLDKVDISTQSNAIEAISYIDASIEYVSSEKYCQVYL